MESKIIRNIGIGAGCAVLIAASALAVLSKDKTAPVISVPDDEITYEEGTDDSVLLEGVTATDNKDGDVSASVVVDQIVAMDDGQTGKVIYAARDKNNNIGNAVRLINYIPLPTAKEELEAAKAEEAAAQKAEEEAKAQAAAEEKAKKAEEEAAKKAEEEAAEAKKAEEEEAKKAEEEEAAAKKAAEKAQKAAEKQAAADAKAAEKAQAAAEKAAKAAADEALGVPKIVLKKKYVEVKRTTYFNPYAYIKSATDDKDNVMARLTVNSNVDTSTPGTYTVTYYCTDTEGNQSNVATLTVLVLEDNAPVN